MVITIGPELEAAINKEAEKIGMDPQGLALQVLWDRFVGPIQLSEPRDEWERKLRQIGGNYGASLTDRSLSREELYD